MGVGGGAAAGGGDDDMCTYVVLGIAFFLHDSPLFPFGCLYDEIWGWWRREEEIARGFSLCRLASSLALGSAQVAAAAFRWLLLGIKRWCGRCAAIKTVDEGAAYT